MLYSVQDGLIFGQRASSCCESDKVNKIYNLGISSQRIKQNKAWRYYTKPIKLHYKMIKASRKNRFLELWCKIFYKMNFMTRR